MSGFDSFTNADPDAESGGTDNLTPPADGVYVVELLDAGAFISKAKSELIAKFVLREIETRFEWTVLMLFRSPGQANMSKRQIRDIGVAVDQITDTAELDKAMSARVGTYHEVDVVTNGDFRNTYLRGERKEQQPPPAAVTQPPPQSQTSDDDDIPF